MPNSLNKTNSFVEEMCMKEKIKKICLMVSIIFGGAILGFILICLVYMIPTERISRHVRESGNYMVKEGDYWELLPGKNTTSLDNFTDAIMILTAAYNGKENVIDKAVNNYRIYGDGLTKQESLQISGLNMDDGKLNVKSYPRYWHGYMLFLKPLLYFFDLNEIRDINSFMILGYLSIISILLYKEEKGRYIIPYLLACTFMNPATISASLQFSTVFHTVSIALIILLSFFKYEKFKKNMWVYFILIGMTTSYVDFLTYPLVSLAFPLIFYIILSQERRLRKSLITTIVYSISWCSGYGGMWCLKWVISSILVKKNYIIDAIHSITVRTGDAVGEKNITLLNVYTKVLKYFLVDNALQYLVFMFIIICMIGIFLSGKIKRNYSASIMFLLVSLSPFIWYAVLKNHSYMHSFFTYRTLAVWVLGISCFCMPLLDIKSIKTKFHMN